MWGDARDDSAGPGEGRPEGIPARVHVLGAGGAGVSGLARLLVGRGVRISGHDRAHSAMLDVLAGICDEITLGASASEHLPDDAELVVRSASVPDDDPQVLSALARGTPVLKYAEVLWRLAPPELTLAVAGTHGKTTTAWMLWSALAGLHADHARRCPAPAALIGGLHRGLHVNAVPGEPGGWFVVEACEYDRTFLNLAPRGAVITNVEADHLDYYGSLEAIIEAFAAFARLVHEDGLLVVGSEVPEEVEAAAACRVWRLGREVDVQLLGERRGCFELSVLGPEVECPPLRLALPGRHCADDAALAMTLALGLCGREARGVAPALVAGSLSAGLADFPGVARRFEPWGQTGGVDVVHDYAHHPTEVRVTLEGARRFFGDRPLVVLFQPHQHSRTAHFLEDFADSLRSAHRVVVSDVYGARRQVPGERGAGSPELVAALRRRNVDSEHGGDLAGSIETLCRALPSDAAVLVLGAGDVEHVRDDLLAKLALRGAPLR